MFPQALMEPQAIHAVLAVSFTARGVVFPHALVADIKTFKCPRIDHVSIVPRHHQHGFVAEAWVARDVSVMLFWVHESRHEGHDLARDSAPGRKHATPSAWYR